MWRDADGCVKRELKDRTSYTTGTLLAGFERGGLGAAQGRTTAPYPGGALAGELAPIGPELRARDYPFVIGSNNGFYGTPRKLLGPENVLYTFYDDPELIKDMNSYLADFWIALYDQVLDQVDADCALIWEDMCYRTAR